MLWDNARQIIWSTRRFIPGFGAADAVAARWLCLRLAKGLRRAS